MARRAAGPPLNKLPLEVLLPCIDYALAGNQREMWWTMLSVARDRLVELHGAQRRTVARRSSDKADRVTSFYLFWQSRGFPRWKPTEAVRKAKATNNPLFKSVGERALQNAWQEAQELRAKIEAEATE